MDKLVKLAIVGLGAVAKKHINAILKFPHHLQLVAIVDSQADTLSNYVKTLGVTGFACLEEMLEKSDADIVILCTPSGLHAQQTIRCIENAKQVIVEKPMALTWHEGLAMREAADKAKLKLRIVHQHRVNPVLLLLKQTIDAQRFGKIFQININVFWTRPQAYYDAAPWRGSRDLDGGALMNQASHTVDWLHWLFGPIQAVQAIYATQARKIETEDSCVLNVRWKQGTLGSFNLSTLAYGRNLETSLTVLGEKGSVKLTGSACSEIAHWEFADQSVNDSAMVAEINKKTAEFLEDTHYYYYANLVDELENNTCILPDVTEGLKTLEILVAAQLAAEQAITVNLPLAEVHPVCSIDHEKIESVE